MEKIDLFDVAYARVSGQEQANDTNALTQQKYRLEQAGATRIFTDIEQGKKDDRRALQQLLQHVEAGHVRRIYITRLDRMTRSLVNLHKLVKLFQEYGVTLIVLDQNIDLGTAQGRLLLNILGTLAEWEVDLMSERIKRGKEYGRQQRWASGSCPFGYTVVEHQYQLDHTPYLCLLSDRPTNLALGDEPIQGRTIAMIARDCIDLYFQHWSLPRTIQAIHTKYGVGKTRARCNGTDCVLHWTKRGLAVWLRNPVLEGHTTYNKSRYNAAGKRVMKPREEWDFVYDTHPDQILLSVTEAAEIERMFEANSHSGYGTFGAEPVQIYGPKPPEAGHLPYAYQVGLVYCTECHSRCTKKTVHRPERDYGYYGCRHAGHGCSNHKNVKRSEIDIAVIAAILARATEFTEGMPACSFQAYRTERLRELETQLAHVKTFPGFNPATVQFQATLEAQIQEERAFLYSQRMDDRTVSEIILAGTSMGVWQTLSGTDKSRIYRRLIERIFIRDGQVVSVLFRDQVSGSNQAEVLPGC